MKFLLALTTKDKPLAKLNPNPFPRRNFSHAVAVGKVGRSKNLMSLVTLAVVQVQQERANIMAVRGTILVTTSFETQGCPHRFLTRFVQALFESCLFAFRLIDGIRVHIIGRF